MKRALLLCLGLASVLNCWPASWAAAADDNAWAIDKSRETTFATVDIVVDSGTQPLAAYQVLFSAGNGARIVGIEGGEPNAFREPPHYDPKAIQGQRVILAAFTLAQSEPLPAGKVRVATIHLQIQPGKNPRHQIQLQTAGGATGVAIRAQASFTRRNQP
jgi:hypothetical protein